MAAEVLIDAEPFVTAASYTNVKLHLNLETQSFARFANMGGGNGQKSATARARKQAEKDAEKATDSFGSQGSRILGGPS